ncbi:MAG: amino acid ABC transporter permease [Acidimicrobiia bacterium]|nr:amino acid ABC transporter permease [Acidimicrobiia bacterium]
MDFQFLLDEFPGIWEGVDVTIGLFAWSLLYGTLGGLVLALMRLSRFAVLRGVSAAITWVGRGIPPLILLFFAFFVAPELGITLERFPSAVLGLSLWTAVYEGEVIRAGISGVDTGQWEASEALGMTPRLYMRRIIIPQGVRIMIPPYIGNAMTLLKQTSIASIVTITEITLLANRVISFKFKALEPLLTIAFIYLALNTVLQVAQQGLERTFRLRV